jgi:hypothetical protein
MAGQSRVQHLHHLVLLLEPGGKVQRPRLVFLHADG